MQVNAAVTSRMGALCACAKTKKRLTIAASRQSSWRRHQGEEMETWKKNLLKEMRFVDSEHTMFEKIAQHAAELGFEFCSFGIRTPLPVTNPVTVVLTTYPKTFQQIYEQSDYVSIDPVVQHALWGNMEMIAWTDETRFSRNKEVLRITRDAGVYSGVSQPIRGSLGVAALLDLSGYKRALPASEIEEKKSGIIWLANFAFQNLSPVLIENYMPAAEIKLTERELSILRWLAEGKTTEDIADILSIAKRTVDFHINNAVAKLEVPNRTAATVQAALLGLL